MTWEWVAFFVGIFGVIFIGFPIAMARLTEARAEEERVKYGRR